MQIVADLHLHSKYSRAVSKHMLLPELARVAAVKGIDLLAIPDWTHSLWLEEVKEQVVEVNEGIYELRGPVESSSRGTSSADSRRNASPDAGPAGAPRDSFHSCHPLFVLSSEVSCMFRKDGVYHAVHVMIVIPSFATVEKINKALVKHGQNLTIDGRPMLALSPEQVAELVLEIDSTSVLFPAHSWTPWFGYYGEHGGFDSITQGFGLFERYIHAVETGLGADPAMNWRISELKERNILSFSDAHSPSKIGREATVFEVPSLTYQNITKAISSSFLGEKNQPHVSYTIEFYPQEGKYHYTGHRKCNYSQSPEETNQRGLQCPVCGKKLTVGAMQRVEDLAGEESRTTFMQDENGVRWVHYSQSKRPPFVNLVPLQEILGEVLSVGVSSRKVQGEYLKITEILGTELDILLRTNPEDLEKAGGQRFREAVMKVRSGDIVVIPGYDGKFGTVKIWPDSASSDPPSGQIDLL